jgi:hypothetical protein
LVSLHASKNLAVGTPKLSGPLVTGTCIVDAVNRTKGGRGERGEDARVIGHGVAGALTAVETGGHDDEGVHLVEVGTGGAENTSSVFTSDCQTTTQNFTCAQLNELAGDSDRV